MKPHVGGAVGLIQGVNPFVMTELLLRVRWLLKWPSSRRQEGVRTGRGNALFPLIFMCAHVAFLDSIPAEI